MSKAIIPNITLNPDNIDDYYNYAWLGLGDVREISTQNKLLSAEWDDPTKLPELIVQTARDPEYLHFFIKYVLNIDIQPFQTAIMHILWNRAFPMFIASRGASKSFTIAMYVICRAVLHQGCRIAVVGASLRQSMVIFNYIQAIWNNAPILRDICGGAKAGPKKAVHMAEWKCGSSVVMFLPLGDGSTIRGQRANIVICDEFACLDRDTIIETDKGLIRIEDCLKYDNKDLGLFNEYKAQIVYSDKYFKTPLTDVYQVKTRQGYSFKCSSIHQVKTLAGFKLAKDLTNKDYLYFENNYIFPNDYCSNGSVILNEELAWLLGVLVAEGSINHENTISITNTDMTLITRIKDILQKYTTNKISIDYKPSCTDDRGWICKEQWTIRCCDTEFRKLLYALGLDYSTAIDKKIPSKILLSPKTVVASFLGGLFEGDGSCFLWSDKDKENRLGVAYYSVSEQLVTEVQIILKKFDILSSKNFRKSKISTNPQWFVRLNGEDAFTLGSLLRIPKWSSTLESSIIYRDRDLKYIVWNKQCKRWKVRVNWAGQDRFLGHFKTIEEAKLERDYFLIHNPKCIRVETVELLPYKDHLYDFNIPATHSFNGNGFCQHNSVNKEIFETVVRGFGATTESGGIHDAIVKAAKRKLMKEQNLEDSIDEGQVKVSTMLGSNQIVMAGTAYYEFNHFYEYFRYYKAIIQSGGDKAFLKKEFPTQALNDVDPSDFAIIRLPYDIVPEGMMDAKMLSQGRATMDPMIFNMEYGACFPSDSEGFFLASYLNAATCPIVTQAGLLDLSAKLYGDKDKAYIMGIDPASEDDNFTICIIEIGPNYRGIVYQWSTNRKQFEEHKREGLVDAKINDYHTYCIKHIRNLKTRFNIVLFVCDAAGGGVHIREGLKDGDKMGPGELPILDMDDENNANKQGEKILKMIEFSDSKWRRDAHYGLRKDLIDRVLVFPKYDGVAIALENLKSGAGGLDSIEEVYTEIQECKTETTLIKHSETLNGTEKWDVPEIKGIDAEKVRKMLKR